MYSHTKVRSFTLIELMVVIAILAILATVLIPRSSGFLDRNTAKSVAKELRELIRFYQQKSLAESRSYRISFYPGSSNYKVEIGTGLGYTTVETLRLKYGVFVSWTSLAFNRVEFDRNGGPTPQGGEVALKRGQQEVILDIEDQTGSVTIR
jgi:prepilin-type N-terminal cleavage/methylation domain-containing protein